MISFQNYFRKYENKELASDLFTHTCSVQQESLNRSHPFSNGLSLGSSTTVTSPSTSTQASTHPYLESSTSMDDRFDKNPQVSSSFPGFIPFQANSEASGARII